jgi:hypothetical protein
MNRVNDIECAIAKLRVTTSARTDKRILEDAFAALQEAAPRKLPGAERNIWQMVVTSRVVELAAIAAVILIAFTLFFRAPAAKAVTLRQIYEALEKVRNVCTSSFTTDKEEPLQQIWTSQALKMILFKTRKEGQIEFALWDIPGKVLKIKYLPSGSVQTVSASAEDLAKVEMWMVSNVFGLVPFSNLSNIPEGAQWSRIDDPNIAATLPGTEVYDLIWPQKSITSEMVIFRKWRVFVDTHTNLPKRTESYSKLETQGDYQLVTYNVVTYPSESEIQALIRSTFGPGDGSSKPGYIGTPEPSRGGAGEKR